MKIKRIETKLKLLRDSSASWVKGNGPCNHIAISSRLRLARNLLNIPFPNRANDEQLKTVLKNGIKVINDDNNFNGFKVVKLETLSAIETSFLVEKRLISFALANSNRPYRALIYDTNEVASIMINEEDHYRIQCILPGFQLKRAWEHIDIVDNKIEESVEYAFNDVEGFLTSCPTNVGTGLRASVMLHLPALFLSNKLNELLKEVSKKGYAVRGFYGEGTDFQGNLFQISNQSTLGLTEMQILENLEVIVSGLIEKEQTERGRLMTHSRDKIEDQVMRSYGILTNAKIISTAEAVDLLSKIRFGIEMGTIIKNTYDTINRLMLITQPGYLQLIKGCKMNQKQRGLARACLIQELLN